jgi:phage terminase small subunit
MNERQRRFVAEYIACRNITEAARRAGYSPTGASTHGGRLLRHRAVIAALVEAGVAVAPPTVGAPLLRPDDDGLNPRQRRFIAEYAVSRNGLQAARRAGYGASAAAARASKLLRHPKVIAALDEKGVAILYGAFARDPDDRSRPVAPFELSLRQQRFVAAYLETGSCKEAALRAGYTRRRPSSAGAAVLRHPLVKAALAAERAKLAERAQIDAARVTAEYARIAFANIADFVEWGPGVTELRWKDDVSADARAAILAIDLKTDASGTIITRIKLQSKLAALDALARHVGLDGRGAVKPAAPPQPDKSAREELRRRIRRMAENLAAELAKKKA